MSANPIAVDLLAVAKKLDNYDVNATAGGLWTDTTHYRATVPANKRWFLFGGAITRDASQTVNVSIYDSSDNPIIVLAGYSAGTGTHSYPIEGYSGHVIFPFPMDPGDYVEALFGGAQGVTAAATCVVLEVNI